MKTIEEVIQNLEGRKETYLNELSTNSSDSVLRARIFEINYALTWLGKTLE